MLKLCVSGLGKAGIQTAKYLLHVTDVQLVSAICSPGSSKAGHDLGEIIGERKQGIPVYPSNRIEPCVFDTKPDVVIDFSTPEAALQNSAAFSKMGLNLVIGTTGFVPAQEKKLFSTVHKHRNGLIYAPNITRGVNAMMLLTELASRILDNYDTEIVEMHHKHKQDVPSGTALKIADSIETGQKTTCFEQHHVPISSVRAGGIVGIHQVMLVGENDMLVLSHQSFSRNAFAEGALYAARFIQGKTGIFEMRDVLHYDTILTDLFSENLKTPPHQKPISN